MKKAEDKEDPYHQSLLHSSIKNFPGGAGIQKRARFVVKPLSFSVLERRINKKEVWRNLYVKTEAVDCQNRLGRSHECSSRLIVHLLAHTARRLTVHTARHNRLLS